MSISETNAKARAAGMTYGQYCDARDHGLLSAETSADPSPSVPCAHPVSQKIKWTVELKNDLHRFCEQGLSLDEISERMGIDKGRVRSQINHMKYRDNFNPPKKPASKAKSSVLQDEAVSIPREKGQPIFDSTDPMCVLEFLKKLVVESFSPNEITAIYAARENDIAEIQYKIDDELWIIQVRKDT